MVAATDYVRAVPDQIRQYVAADRRFTSLGTDGFGRSDTGRHYGDTLEWMPLQLPRPPAIAFMILRQPITY